MTPARLAAVLLAILSATCPSAGQSGTPVPGTPGPLPGGPPDPYVKFETEVIKKCKTLIDRAAKGKPDTRRARLELERAELGLVMLKGAFERIKIGKDPLSSLFEILIDIRTAHTDMEPSHDDRVAMAELMVDFGKMVEQEMEGLRAAGLANSATVAKARFNRIGLEIDLLRLTEKADRKKK